MQSQLIQAELIEAGTTVRTLTFLYAAFGRRVEMHMLLKTVRPRPPIHNNSNGYSVKSKSLQKTTKVLGV